MKNVWYKLSSLLCLCFVFFSLLAYIDEGKKDKEWPEYLGGGDRNHYSDISQINTRNVGSLKIAGVSCR